MLEKCVAIAMALVLAIGFEASEACAQQDVERHTSEQLSVNVHFMWQQRKFDELEAWATEYRTQRTRWPSGGFYMYAYYLGFGRAFDDRETLPRARMFWKQAYEEWVKAYPTSATPHLANAQTLLAEAWTLRGTKFAHEVWQEDMDAFMARLEEARDALLKHEKLASTDFYYYSIMAKINLPLGEPRAKFFGRLEEGIKRYPFYQGYYHRGAEYLDPKWGGDVKSFVAWVNSAATRAPEGLIVYAGIYDDHAGAAFAKHLAQTDEIHRAKLRQGITETLAKRPTIQIVRGMLRLGCTMRDAAEVEKIFVAWRTIHPPSAPTADVTPAALCNWPAAAVPSTSPGVLPPPAPGGNLGPQKTKLP